MTELKEFAREYVDEIEPKRSRFNVLGYFKIPFILSYFINNSVNQQTDHNVVDVLSPIKNYIYDPLAILGIGIGSLVMYIYFANDFMCKMVGFFYPCYLVQKLLYNKEENSDKIKFFMKYFVVYGHTEFILSFPGWFGMQFYHLRIILLISLLYTLQYRPNTLEYIYQKTIFYDNVIVQMITKGISKIYREFTNISNQLNQKFE